MAKVGILLSAGLMAAAGQAQNAVPDAASLAADSEQNPGRQTDGKNPQNAAERLQNAAERLRSSLERSERPHVSRVERPERVQNHERVMRPERVERPEKPHRPGR